MTKKWGKSFLVCTKFCNFASDLTIGITQSIYHLIHHFFMELQGKIIRALEPKTGTSARGDWKVQEFVLETIDGQFSRKMVFSVFGEEKLQRFNIQEGQDVNVSFDIDAREYNGRWFNSIRAFDVRPIIPNAVNPGIVATSVASPVPNNPVAPSMPPAADTFGSAPGDSGEDLPF